MLKTLSKCVRQYKLPSFLTVICMILEVLFEIVIPLFMANLLDLGVMQGNMAVVIKYCAFLGISALMQLLSGVVGARLASKASAGFASNIRSDMYKNVQNFSFSNIDKFSTASIVTRLTTDVTNIQNAYQMMIRMAIRSPIMLIFALVAAFKIDAGISVIFLFVMPVLVIGLVLIIKRVYPLFRRVFKTYDKLNNVVQEDLRGIRVVKSFNQEKHEIEHFNSISNDIYKYFSKAERILAFNSPLMQICMYSCLILISWFGAVAIVESGNNDALGLTTGQLTALITYAIQILMSLMMVSMVFAMFTIAQSSANRIAEILNEKSDIVNPKKPLKEVKNGSICFDNVSFVYNSKASKKVLDKINIDIKSGETVGILGGTGSSKTSLVQLIPRLYDVTEGNLLVGGINVKEYDIETLRNSVAMVLQKNELFTGTIKENLRWGNENASDEELIHACKLACADEFIKAMPEGYDTFIEQGGTNVSGGQKQRLCIARALLKKPKILILDDSTSAVDTKTDKLIQQSFSEYIPNTTKIIIAQRISSLQHADKIIVLDDGKIVSIGNHDELFKSCDIYREVYDSQQKGDEK